MRQSILDEVLGNTNRLKSLLGGADRRKVDEYLTSLREIEQQVDRAAKDGTVIEPGIEKPFGVPVEFPDYFRLMSDMMILAFKADITRISTMIVGREGSVRAYPEIGVADGHHPLTHHQGNLEMLAKVRQINELHARLFAEFLQKMKNTPEGDSNLLDQSLIVLRQRPVGRQRPHPRSAADAARRPRRRLRHAGPPRHLPARNAGHQSVHDDAGSGGRDARPGGRFDRTVDRSVAGMSQDPKGPLGPPPIGVVYNTSMARPDAALALAALYVSASRRESRMGAVCVTGAGLDTAIFCDIVVAVLLRRPGTRAVQQHRAAGRPRPGIADAARSTDGESGRPPQAARRRPRNTPAPSRNSPTRHSPMPC